MVKVQEMFKFIVSPLALSKLLSFLVNQYSGIVLDLVTSHLCLLVTCKVSMIHY